MADEKKKQRLKCLEPMEKARKALSADTEANVDIENIANGVKLENELITRDELLEIIADYK